MSQETRAFKMHPQLLFDVIQRQAGTLTKAILEGVMNSIDAKASFVKIVLDQDSLLIVDDGKGFRSRQEIENFFEVFGAPHDESEGKTYGTFRMGRGQLFAFGKNDWRTGNFGMSVDIKNKGLDYELKTNHTKMEGCEIRIQLYDKLAPSDLHQIERDIENCIKYAPIKATFNNNDISVDPAKEKWDLITDEAYINFKTTGNISVFNLGIYVCDLSSWKYGVGGEILSKQQLKVNFARNDVQHDCSVWKKITPLIKEAAGKKIKQTRRTWTDNERQYAVDQYFSDDISISDFLEMPVITDCTGSNYKLRLAINKIAQTYGKCVTVAPENNVIADKLMQEKRCFVFSHTTLNRFNCFDVQQLINKLYNMFNIYSTQKERLTDVQVLDFEALRKGFNENYRILNNKEIGPSIKALLEAARRNLCIISESGYYDGDRALHVGIGPASAWTDAKTYIAIHKEEFGTGFDKEYEFFLKIGHLLLHEMCHNESSENSHQHDKEFYQKYHDDYEKIFMFAKQMQSSYLNILKRDKRRTQQKLLKIKDKIFKIKELAGEREEQEQLIAASK